MWIVYFFRNSKVGGLLILLSYFGTYYGSKIFLYIQLTHLWLVECQCFWRYAPLWHPKWVSERPQPHGSGHKEKRSHWISWTTCQWWRNFWWAPTLFLVFTPQHPVCVIFSFIIYLSHCFPFVGCKTKRCPLLLMKRTTKKSWRTSRHRCEDGRATLTLRTHQIEEAGLKNGPKINQMSCRYMKSPCPHWAKMKRLSVS